MPQKFRNVGIIDVYRAILTYEKLEYPTDPMLELVEFLNNNRNPNNKVLSMMLTTSKNVFRVVDLLREVPPFSYQDFTWLDENLPNVFAPEKVTRAYTE